MLAAADLAPYIIPGAFGFAGIVVTVGGGIISLVISNRRTTQRGEKVVAAVSEWETRWAERGRMLEGYQSDLAAASAREQGAVEREQRCQARLAAVEDRLAVLEKESRRDQ